MTHRPRSLDRPPYTRRAWLQRAAAQTGAVLVMSPGAARALRRRGLGTARLKPTAGQLAPGRVPPEQILVLADQAVEAARSAGARYADARCTRIVYHEYRFDSDSAQLYEETEVVGFGVRALVNGGWGFVACPLWMSEQAGPETVVRLARAAVAQASVNARLMSRPVDLGQVPVAAGTWVTPVQQDAFDISIEEKLTAMRYWAACARRVGLELLFSRLCFVRHEQVVVTSEGTRVRQTCYESGGNIMVMKTYKDGSQDARDVVGVDPAGRGWELIQEAHIPEQIEAMPERFQADLALKRTAQPVTIGRYPLVCDGATMAALVEGTVGVATQLDRALGYEADAGGTSFLDDPLAMVGHFPVASPLVTVTANRSAPTQLATVQWDAEGVVPQPFTLIQDGTLVNFQTTRESAAWLASYYQGVGHPGPSHGCAGAQDATYVQLQHMPNLALAPGAGAIALADLVADVSHGLLVEGAQLTQIDSQARTGILGGGRMRKIVNGQLGPFVKRGAVRFNTIDLWKNVNALGGTKTVQTRSTSVPYGLFGYSSFLLYADEFSKGYPFCLKGQPVQGTSHSVQAAAALITNQPVILDLAGT